MPTRSKSPERNRTSLLEASHFGDASLRSADGTVVDAVVGAAATVVAATGESALGGADVHPAVTSIETNPRTRNPLAIITLNRSSYLAPRLATVADADNRSLSEGVP